VIDAYKSLTSLGDGIDGINNPRNVAEKGEQQTDPKLHLIDESPQPNHQINSLRLHNIKTKASKRNYKKKKKKRTYDMNYVNRKYYVVVVVHRLDRLIGITNEFEPCNQT
jgi:hypothetical protein